MTRVPGMAMAFVLAWVNGAAMAGPSASGEVFDFTTFSTLADAPVSTSSIAVSASFDQPGGPLGDSFVSALARNDGFIAAAAQLSKPSGDEQEWRARATFVLPLANAQPTPQSFVFDFHIFNMSLRIFDLEGISTRAEIFASVQLNLPAGGSTLLFRIDEVLEGGRASIGLQHNGLLTPPVTFACLVPAGPGCVDFLYTFEPFDGSLMLGTLGPGEAFELQYDLQASVDGRPIGVTGAAARIGDPFDLTGDGGVGGTVRSFATVPAVVPAPSGSWIFVGALVALLAFQRGAYRA